MTVSMNGDHVDLELKLNSLLTDITAAKTSIAGITAKLDTAVAAINAAGTNFAVVAGSNFAALWNMPALNSAAGDGA